MPADEWVDGYHEDVRKGGVDVGSCDAVLEEDLQNGRKEGCLGDGNGAGAAVGLHVRTAE